MLERWPIRDKLLAGVGLLAVIVTVLTASSLFAAFAYRDLVRSLRARSEELPIAAELALKIGDVRASIERLRAELAESHAAPITSISPFAAMRVQDLG